MFLAHRSVYFIRIVLIILPPCLTLQGYIPDPHRLREFVCMPPPGVERLHCTMIRHGEETSGGHYMLYLEYLGGLIPLLKGKRASKIRPEFVIFDPKIKTGTKAGKWWLRITQFVFTIYLPLTFKVIVSVKFCSERIWTFLIHIFLF